MNAFDYVLIYVATVYGLAMITSAAIALWRVCTILAILTALQEARAEADGLVPIERE